MKLNECDLKNIGNWNKLNRAVFIGIASIMLILCFYYLDIANRSDQLRVKKQQEIEVKMEYKNKAALSSNLELYKKQLDEIRLILDELVKKLPSESEIATLLDDLSEIGIANGLKFNHINWEDEIENELFIEIPISLSLVGTYEQLGGFAQEMAKLPRIINLEEINITKLEGEQLLLNLIVKTYSYKEPTN